MTRVGVVGHVEWVEFVMLDSLPTGGQVALGRDAFTRAAGAGGVAAVVAAELGAEVDFFCALGRDANGRAAAAQLEERGVRAHVAWREQQTRRALGFLVDGGERAVVTIGDRLEPRGDDDLPWQSLGAAGGVYFTAGDAAALAHARAAAVVVATPRARDAFADGGPSVDALVFSAHDRDESTWAQQLSGRTRFLLATEGSSGGRWWGEAEGSWQAVAPERPIQDDYGCGDSFAAGFTLGLARGLSVAAAAELGARAGARMLTRAGAP
ncbi:MAG TPA: PfkB family carbohydrate kinase [Solirubrobacteraceae bacterium]|nr:PfkB family carbohydrate kinase [Solirubrobacteraceae bacterium]